MPRKVFQDKIGDLATAKAEKKAGALPVGWDTESSFLGNGQYETTVYYWVNDPVLNNRRRESKTFSYDRDELMGLVSDYIGCNAFMAANLLRVIEDRRYEIADSLNDALIDELDFVYDPKMSVIIDVFEIKYAEFIERIARYDAFLEMMREPIAFDKAWSPEGGRY